MSKRERKPTITGKVVLFLMALVVVSNVAIGTVSYQLHRSQSIAARAREAEHIAITVAHRIDGDRFEEIMRTLEKNAYWYEIQEYAGRIARELGTEYIYIIDANYDDEVVYFGEGCLGEPFDLGQREELSTYAPEMFETLRTGSSTRTEPYPSGEYGEMVSGFAPIFNSRGEVSGVVGVDFYFEDILAEISAFGLWLFGIMAAFLLLFALIASAGSKRLVGKPLTALDEAAMQLSRGEMDIHVDIRSKSEIGRLSHSFNQMVSAIKTQVSALEAIAQGDLAVSVQPRGEKDTMGHAIVQILHNLNGMFEEIGHSAARVAVGSGQIAGGAQTLAQGSAEQAASIEKLSALISDVTALTNENAGSARKAAGLADTVKADAETGAGRMDRLTQAVEQISEASVSIGKVIKVIDDIAFQTNILALNAAVEAARAGQHGKGFSVVADEVRNLAAKSAEAAKNTGSLITNSVEKAELGATIARETAESLDKIIQGINDNAVLVNAITRTFETQQEAISQIGDGVDQVSRVVHQNSATAEQAAAASEELSGQSAMLHDLLARFKTREKDNAHSQIA